MIINILADFPGIPVPIPDPFPDPFQDHFFDSNFANFLGIAMIMFGIFILCAIFSKTFSEKETDRVLTRKPLDSTLNILPETPVIRSYLPELMGKLKPIELTLKKYTKLPSPARFKKLFEPHEVAIPPTDQSIETFKLGRRNNYIKLACLGGIWGVISIFLGIWGCILSYLLFIYIYAHWRVPLIDPIEKCTETTIIPFTHQFQPLDLNDLLYGWLNFEKRTFSGLFKEVPAPADLQYSEYVKSTYVEIEVDAEYFTISHHQKELPYSQAAGESFFAEPFPVKMPREFGDSSQEYACQGTLEKKNCEICGGKGAVRCPHCDGSGKVICPSCNGKGYHTRSRTVYETHFGKRTSHTEHYRVSCSCGNGIVTCDICSGSGQVICPTCKGERSIGVFAIRRYEFHHKSKVKTFKETQSQVADAVELTDIPNEEGRLITLSKGEGFSGDNPDKVPSISDKTIQALKSAREEFERENSQLPNLIFDQYAYREFPELSVQFTFRDKKYLLKGRGFKPLQKKYFTADKIPVSWRQILICGLPPLLWIIVASLI